MLNLQIWHLFKCSRWENFSVLPSSLFSIFSDAITYIGICSFRPETLRASYLHLTPSGEKKMEQQN